MNQETMIEIGALMVPLMAFGALMKNAIPKLNNNLIPLILAIVGPLAFAAHKQSFDSNTLLQGFLGAIAAVGTHGAFRSTNAVVPRKKKPKDTSGTGGSAALAILLGLTLFISNGCATRLAPEGIYRGDVILYNADRSIPLAYYTLHEFVTWEYENREALKTFPEIGNAANYVRMNAEAWITAAEQARERYALNPTEKQRSILEQTLRALDAGMAQAVKLKGSKL